MNDRFLAVFSRESRASLFVVAGMVFLVSTGRAANRLSMIDTVALTGTPATGMNDGTIFASLSHPAISPSGHVFFSSRLSGPAVNSQNEFAQFLSNNTLHNVLVFRFGQEAPSEPVGVTAGLVDAVPVLADGTVYGYAELRNGGSPIGSALWANRSGQVERLVRSGLTIPGTSVTPKSVSSRFVTSDGDLVFTANIQRTNENSYDSIVVYSDGQFVQPFPIGYPIPSLGDGIVIGSTNVPSAINSSKQILFTAQLAGPGVHVFNSDLLGLLQDNVLQVVTRQGDQAPGMATGVTYGTRGSRSLSDVGHVAFGFSLAGPGITQENNTGIFLWQDGLTEVVVREGDPAPGYAAVQRFSEFNSSVAVNSHGNILFRGRVGLDDGYWRRHHTGLIQDVVFPGKPVPDSCCNHSFSNLGVAHLTQDDFVVFAAVTNPVPDPDYRSIWASDPTGRLFPLVQPGDEIEVAAGDVRVVQRVDMPDRSGVFQTSNGTDGYPGPINSRGQVTFLAWFTDGSQGVFVTNALVIVPEPSSIGLACGGITMIAAAFVLRRKGGAASPAR